ncbi:MAG: hypothetical protein PHS53_02615 [Candidatus Pacebacteria bacterium]|nr:hypothetical protein [Candidatus Paceibacterota bacterium]MDD5357016.1 hypothetical protein [Candidatus Paceibacterota bacterium]
MKISIIDIGTQSLKHYIFEVKPGPKKLIHFERYSDVGLGVAENIAPEAFQRTSELLSVALVRNKKEGVKMLKVLGTEALRKAKNAPEFCRMVEDILSVTPEVISQEKETLYLYKGFVNVIPSKIQFAAVNIGGGSTELVFGDKKDLKSFNKFPFGVKFLKGKFLRGDGAIDWDSLDKYLEAEMIITEKADIIFVTGILHFVELISSPLKLSFTPGAFSAHTMLFSPDGFSDYVQKLRRTPIDELKKMYPKDPAFCDNIAVGQSVYLAIAKKVGATQIFPSNNDLTDGVIEEMCS